MNRKYTAQMFMQAIEKMKNAHPDFAFTTDVIVGFPGETEVDFEETLAIMRKVRFAKVHMFPYSKRDKTRAALYPNQVPVDVIQSRKHKVLEVAEETSYLLRQEYVGREMDVLLEGQEDNVADVCIFSGHTRNFLPVQVQEEGQKISSNQIVRVKLIENTSKWLRGKIL